ncbi:hypothetical protein CHS0354_028687 [Potamilus streckersoni]|uniref:Uncharacterized protein n=1 Tax=Potamilus streckersoni TaxID=2493646 RepID=A0AAE0T647_9BIVA|nr:hypothetical protein CHS0354_028687 [Potamilus streckersoni]
MAADPQTDLFTLGLANTKPLKEQVTPYKLALFVLIIEYSVMKKTKYNSHYKFGQGDRVMVYSELTDTEKRSFMITILQLLQSQDLTLRELTLRIQDMNIRPVLFEIFKDRSYRAGA